MWTRSASGGQSDPRHEVWQVDRMMEYRAVTYKEKETIKPPEGDGWQVVGFSHTEKRSVNYAILWEREMAATKTDVPEEDRSDDYGARPVEEG